MIDNICHGTGSIQEAQLEHIWHLYRARMYADLLSRRQVEFLVYELFDMAAMNRRQTYSQQGKALYDSYILQFREPDESLLKGCGRLPNVLMLVLSHYTQSSVNGNNRLQLESTASYLSASPFVYSQYLFVESVYAFFLLGLQLLDDCSTAVNPALRKNSDQLLAFLTSALKAQAQRYEAWWAEFERELGPDALTHKRETLSSDIEKSLLDHLPQLPVDGLTKDHLVAWRERYFGGYSRLLAMIDESIDDARKQPALLAVANELENRLAALEAYLDARLCEVGSERVFEGTIHNTAFNESVAGIVIAWLWLKQGLVAHEAMPASSGEGRESSFYSNKIRAMHSYFQIEVTNLKL